VSGHLRYLGHSTVLVEMDGVSILTDPLLVDRLGLLHRHTDAVAHLIEGVDIDIVLISHAHHDHLHLPSLRRIRGRPRVVVPRGLGTLVSRSGHEVIEVAAGERFDIRGVGVEAIRAEHDGRRRPFGPTAGALGYRIVGSSRLYFAGDTDLCPEMDGLAGAVDVALLPVWGWGPRLGSGHLDPGRAAEAVRRMRPRVAIPIHWGTFYPFTLARFWPHPLGDPPHEFAREATRIASATEVRILAPGATTDLPSGSTP
jgi:L-ascorbate metabolism protein UlaG (beta-lactamase superfamily)